MPKKKYQPMPRKPGQKPRPKPMPGKKRKPRGKADPRTDRPTMRGGTAAARPKRGTKPKKGPAKPRVEHKARKPKASKGASKGRVEHKAKGPKRGKADPRTARPGMKGGTAAKRGKTPKKGPTKSKPRIEHTARKPKVSKGASKGRIEHKAKGPKRGKADPRTDRPTMRGGTVAARKNYPSRGNVDPRTGTPKPRPKPSRNVATGGGHHNLFDDYNKWNTKFHAGVRKAAARKGGMGTGFLPGVAPTKKRKK